MTQDENVYFESGSVKITNTRAILSGKTYAMSNVTSVSLQMTPANKAPGIITILLGIIVFGCVWGAFDSFLVGLVLGGLGVFFGVSQFLSAKDKYSVRLGSASGESDVLSSGDRSQIQEIVDAINEAIIRRG